ncbi:hypothetical protein Sjap_007028 [Stephania japonica]|uniref:CRM domain-containing protein n=1 Tax=Stephania japonica TaxID=461633 RepID=A0AAP0K857_9MAGN
MAIVATLPSPNLFTPPPSKPHNDSTDKPPPSPPIPIPKYPPRTPKPSKPPNSLSFHRRTNYYKPVSDGVIATDRDDRCVVVGDSGVSYLLPGAPFEFQFSYSETPKVKPLAMREPAFLPFAPPAMPRPWTGKAPLKKSKKKQKIPLFDSFNPPMLAGKKGAKVVEMPGPFRLGKAPVEGRSREEVLGDPLSRAEMKLLIKPHLSHNRQVNLGRDGLTHNMLELIHTHWKRQRVCKVRCKGVPTVDMDNVCHHLEEKTGGKIIHRVGGVVFLFRGRNYNYRTRPQYPIMLWKPAAPVYPKLIQEAPEGLTKDEADELRMKGKNLIPICKLAKNGTYINLVSDVRNAFEETPLVKINCEGMHASDYKKLGAKLKELVPCVLLSFDDEQILMWRGESWKFRYPESHAPVRNDEGHNKGTSSMSTTGSSNDITQNSYNKTWVSRQKLISLWKRAIESSKALLLEETELGPDALLEKVEEFAAVSQVAEHSYTALIISGQDATSNSKIDVKQQSELEGSDIDDFNEESDTDSDEVDEAHDPFEHAETSIPFGSLPLDAIAEKLSSD